MAPLTFDFEMGPLISPPTTPANLAARSLQLVEELRIRAKGFRTNKLLIPFGMDFRFIHADWQFGNMTPIVDYINSHAGETSASISAPTHHVVLSLTQR
jgi:hypothetical protein